MPIVILQALAIIGKKLGSIVGTLAMLAAFGAFVAAFVSITVVMKTSMNALPAAWICGLSAFGVLNSIKIALSMIAGAFAVRFTRFIAARISATLE